MRVLLVLLAAAIAVPAAAAPAQDLAMPAELNAAMRGLAASAPQTVRNFRAAAVPAATAAPINSGFLALGAAGGTGSIKGPPMGGDGSYRVVKNDPTEMVFDMNTGYVDGRFTLKRDLATGKDLLGFAGRTKDGPFSDWKTVGGNYAGRVTYNAGSDSGTISWQIGGKQILDSYSGGRGGSRTMTITLKGNKHVFTQN